VTTIWVGSDILLILLFIIFTIPFALIWKSIPYLFQDRLEDFINTLRRAYKLMVFLLMIPTVTVLVVYLIKPVKIRIHGQQLWLENRLGITTDPPIFWRQLKTVYIAYYGNTSMLILATKNRKLSVGRDDRLGWVHLDKARDELTAFLKTRGVKVSDLAP
jgi:hypothetical protein